MEKNAAGSSAASHAKLDRPAPHGARAGEVQEPSARRSPVVLGCFDGNGKCNLLAWRKALAKLKSRSEDELRALAAKSGIKHSATMPRETLLSLLMETEQLCELEFPQPPTWKQFEAACKKKLGKHLTFEYDPGAPLTATIHVKDAETMSACMEWLLKRRRPGEIAGEPLRLQAATVPDRPKTGEAGNCDGQPSKNAEGTKVASPRDENVGLGGSAGDQKGGRANDEDLKPTVRGSPKVQGRADDVSGSKRTEDKAKGEDCTGLPDIVLPSVLAVELLPSVGEKWRRLEHFFPGRGRQVMLAVKMKKRGDILTWRRRAR